MINTQAWFTRSSYRVLVETFDRNKISAIVSKKSDIQFGSRGLIITMLMDAKYLADSGKHFQVFFLLFFLGIDDMQMHAPVQSQIYNQ